MCCGVPRIMAIAYRESLSVSSEFVNDEDEEEEDNDDDSENAAASADDGDGDNEDNDDCDSVYLEVL